MQLHPLYVKTVIPIVLRARQSIPTHHRVLRKNYESSQESAEMFRKNRSLPCACLRNLSQHLKFDQISSKNSFQTSGIVFSQNNGMIGTSLIGKPASNSEPGKSIRGVELMHFPRFVSRKFDIEMWKFLPRQI